MLPCFHGALVQLIERRIVSPVVTGLSPVCTAIRDAEEKGYFVSNLQPLPSDYRQPFSLVALFFNIGYVAQLVEQMAVNHLVAGSNPALPAKADAVEWTYFDFTTWVAGSSPALAALSGEIVQMVEQ